MVAVVFDNLIFEINCISEEKMQIKLENLYECSYCFRGYAEGRENYSFLWRCKASYVFLYICWEW